MSRCLLLGSACLVWTVTTAGCQATDPVRVDSLTFQSSNEWVQERPGHPTRRLQFRVPSRLENVPDAELVIWNFDNMRDDGEGRVIDRNMKRWAEQFAQDDGRAEDPSMKRTEYQINGMPVHVLDISGRYVAESAPGSGIRVNRAGYRMIAAYVVAPQGDYIVKLLGPAEVVSEHAGRFDRFLKSARAHDPTWDGNEGLPPSEPRTVLTGSKAGQ